MPEKMLRFLVNGDAVEVTGIAAQATVLEYLREERGLMGTKEGCAEGDCGACTVVLAEPDGMGGVSWKPFNACIRLLPSIAGKAIFTVESLQSDDCTLHPVQRALVECHGSQCGFCTPGFVMSLFGLYKNAGRPSRAEVADAISGNLCRCTGYRPILDAADRMYAIDPASHDATGWRGPGIADDGSRRVSKDEERLALQLALLAGSDDLRYEADGRTWFAPRTLDAVVAACAANPSARIVAGATDVGLWVTKHQRDLGDIIYVGDCDELRSTKDTADALEIGAAASLSDAFAALDAQWPELREVWSRFASVPVRNTGTLGGNVANGSPIGDSMPVLIALAATVVLRSESATRELPLEDFYLSYQKTALTTGEFVAAIRVPHRREGLLLRAYKVSKRFDQDISAVFACFALSLRDGLVAGARIGCGGVAPVPVRASITEGALAGRAWNDETADAAAQILAGEFAPISDMRASAGFRRTVLGNLMRRFRLETSEKPAATRVDNPRLAPAE
ncbi:MAG TPA: xanthine dehydrogenase small subunit [Casimicrobiaceae bacterium]|nr:xanthine dehydrogenase small subunit [Casimicrobiaceae bacterium]